MDSVDKLLSEATEASAGRTALRYYMNDAKELTTLAGDLALACHRFMRDEAVSQAAVASDEAIETDLSELTFDARRALLKAISCVQKAHIEAQAKAKAARRD